MWTWALVLKGVTTLEHMDQESNQAPRFQRRPKNPRIRRLYFSDSTKATMQEIFGHQSFWKIFLPDTKVLDENLFLFNLDVESISQETNGEGETHNLIRP